MEFEKDYQEMLDYLFGFVDYSLTRASTLAAANFDLDRMRVFMQLLGQPDKAYPILHIAGTKGKGSVAALCAAALQAAGYTVGLYTSPHLEDYNERIQVNGQAISHPELIALVNEFRPHLDAGTQLTTFEITTALAFLYFYRRGVNAAVVEVGLGGRLDATNVVDPLVTVITSISYDHTLVLGTTLAAIAAEKCGIIKPGVPVVTAPQQDEARLVIERMAAERAAPLVQLGREVAFTRLASSLGEGQTLMVQGLGGWLPAAAEPSQLKISLLGAHQVENAALAWAALQAANVCGMKIPSQAVRDGFAGALWPARFEILQKQPPVVVDSAHNRDSALKLRQTVDEYYPGTPLVLLFGASEDKDITGMFAELLPRTSYVVITKSTHPRSADPQALAALARQYGCPAVIIDDVEASLGEAQRLAGGQALVLAAGSIFIAAAVRESWYKRFAGNKNITG